MDILNLTNEQIQDLIVENCVEANITDVESMTVISDWISFALVNASLLSLLYKKLIRIAGTNGTEPLFIAKESIETIHPTILQDIEEIIRNREV